MLMPHIFTLQSQIFRSIERPRCSAPQLKCFKRSILNVLEILDRDEFTRFEKYCFLNLKFVLIPAEDAVKFAQR